ncbi:MAG TPA: crossover junction endodeoxyribonuclease RuvC [Caldisericia bacterium]|nr:crossover junction endodeoxyribonuclease RuvC [Caldisericia bacterium]
MYVFGIDPGLSNLGYAVLEYEREIELLDYGLIETSKENIEGERLNIIFNELDNIYKKYKPEITVIEKLFFKKNVKTAIKIGEVRGVIILLSYINKSKLFELSPSSVKINFTGYGKSNKENMKKMAKILYNIDLDEDDTVDAIALATSFINLNSFNIKSDILS